MRFALCAKRGNVNIKHNKVLVLIVGLGDTQTHWASLSRVARSVPLVSMHQSKLLAARFARWDDIRNKTQLILLPAKHALEAVLLSTKHKVVRTVQLEHTHRPEHYSLATVYLVQRVNIIMAVTALLSQFVIHRRTTSLWRRRCSRTASAPH